MSHVKHALFDLSSKQIYRPRKSHQIENRAENIRTVVASLSSSLQICRVIILYDNYWLYNQPPLLSQQHRPVSRPPTRTKYRTKALVRKLCCMFFMPCYDNLYNFRILALVFFPHQKSARPPCCYYCLKKILIFSLRVVWSHLTFLQALMEIDNLVQMMKWADIRSTVTVYFFPL
jgi:hypothetical protein